MNNVCGGYAGSDPLYGDGMDRIFADSLKSKPAESAFDKQISGNHLKGEVSLEEYLGDLSDGNNKIPYNPFATQGVQHAKSNLQPFPKAADSAFDKQISGNHYKSMKIQPMEYALANGLGYCEATALKYISRWKLKGGIADLDKAIHFIQLLKEYASTHPSEFGLPQSTSTR